MYFKKLGIDGLVLIEPKIFKDERGYFFESFREDLFNKEVGCTNFIQDNESFSTKGTLRGLHYQLPPFAQSKLVRVVSGKVLDVAVDIRKGSPTFGKYEAVILDDKDKKMLFIPRGFAHGYLVLSDTAVFQYKVDNLYSRECERGIMYNDSSVGIKWLFDEVLVLSDKDTKHPLLKNAEVFEEEIINYKG